jgi:type IV pilus assembly protein PilX
MMNPPRLDRSQARGAALIVVLVMLLLASLLLLSGTRRNWLNDKLVATESDQQRAFAAAEALLRDAELDIQGMLADGSACPASATSDVCRTRSNGMGLFPREDDDFDLLQGLVSAQSTRCIAGLCVPQDINALQTALSTDQGLKDHEAVGATYGRFTGARAGDTGNPLLDNAAPSGWYWIEVFRYSTAALIQTGTQGLVAPDPAQPYIYRINAVAYGLRAGTRVHLRSVFIPRPAL